VYYSKGWAIRINAGKNNEIDRFWAAISPHMIEELRYKLPVRFRGVEYIPRPGGKVVVRSRKMKIREIEEIPVTKLNFPSGACGYDLETTTGNYMVGNVLVHNSLMQVYFYDNKWHVATSGMPDAGGQINDYNITFKELFWKTWTDQGLALFSLKPHVCYAFELTGPYNRLVVDYKESKLHYLAARDMRFLVEYGCDSSSLYVKNLNPAKKLSLSSLEDCIETSKSLDPLEYEGYVVVDRNFNRIKIKSAAHVMLHHAKASLSKKRMCEVVRNGEVEEFGLAISSIPALKAIFDEVVTKHEACCANATKAYENIKHIKDQKEFALEAKKTPYATILFQMRKDTRTASQCLSRENMMIRVYMGLIGVDAGKDESPDPSL
jgi:hypothetical protein